MGPDDQRIEDRKTAAKLWGRMMRSANGRRMLQRAGVPLSAAVVCLDTDLAHEVLTRGHRTGATTWTLVTYMPATGAIHISVQQYDPSLSVDDFERDPAGIAVRATDTAMTIGRMFQTSDARKRLARQEVVAISSKELELIDA